jgi:hypothetical protein
VRPEDAWFPASLDQTFRERFLAEPKADNIAAFISELSIAETRASQQALFRPTLLPSATPSLGSVIPTGMLESLRQGSWNCSSYFLSSVAPTSTAFSAFAFIPTLSGLSDPLIPRAGLSYSQIIAILSNLWWMLSLPLQCSIGPNNISGLQSLVDGTPLLRTLAILIDLLRHPAAVCLVMGAQDARLLA